MSEMVVSIDEVSQTFDLSEIFGVDTSGYPEIGMAFGQAAIDRIVDRTGDNKSRMGNKLKGYSASYIASDAFKDFGKSASDVNLELTGSMLSSVDITDFDGVILKIAVVGDTDTKKAYNHQVGDTLPARPWFGLTKKDIDEIAAQFDDDIAVIKEEMERIVEAPSIGSVADLFNLELPSFRSQVQIKTLADILEDL